MKNLSVKNTLLAMCFLLTVSSCGNDNKDKSNGAADDFAQSAYLSDENDTTVYSQLAKERRAKIKALFENGDHVMLCGDPLNEMQNLAQQIAISSVDFLQATKTNDAKPYFCEVFNVLPARESDLGGLQYQGSVKQIFRVELYNYALNLTTIALVNTESKQVLKVAHFEQTQPEIPQHLKDLAIDIAINDPKVKEALGINPQNSDALMAATKTALNNTKCERSRHLCVAPTFLKDDKALWAIVDLTETKIVGLRWTQTGENKIADPITERSLQDEKITECYCEIESNVAKNNWKLSYIITSSDGLRISNVQFMGTPILASAKLVDWHVSYSNSDGFGYSDAVGCPYFSQAAVIAYTEPQILDLMENGKIVGWVLEQSFRSELWPVPCNYNYVQRYEFYNDGRFRVAGASLGRGCGVDGTYRPVFRIDFSNDNHTFSEWTGSSWNNWKTEQWKLQDELTKYTPEGYQYKLESAKGGLYMIPGNGQFNDGGRGDNAYTYITLKKEDKDEGESDLVTIGPCCNTDYRQGPEKFIEPQADPIFSSKLVMWYVPQMKNDGRKGMEYCWAESYLEQGKVVTQTYPCFFGPMFVPYKK